MLRRLRDEGENTASSISVRLKAGHYVVRLKPDTTPAEAGHYVRIGYRTNALQRAAYVRALEPTTTSAMPPAIAATPAIGATGMVFRVSVDA